MAQRAVSVNVDGTLGISGCLWLVVFWCVFFWSAWEPKDALTWILEVAPALLGFAILAFTRRAFPLSSMLYALILVHCLILMVGAKYTYAEVPFFDSLSDYFGWSRNNYDKLGHFMQGFVPALLTREILVRKEVIASGPWLNFLIVCVCLAFSAFYELVEWWAALLIGQDAQAFLGTQGYEWDTQSDMALAALGALTCLFILSRAHDRALESFCRSKPSNPSGL